DGTPGQVLTTDGNGGLSFQSAGSVGYGINCFFKLQYINTGIIDLDALNLDTVSLLVLNDDVAGAVVSPNHLWTDGYNKYFYSTALQNDYVSLTAPTFGTYDTIRVFGHDVGSIVSNGTLWYNNYDEYNHFFKYEIIASDWASISDTIGDLFLGPNLFG